MNQLREFREEAGMTVRELSERSGVSEDTITKIENGHRKGRTMTLRKLAKALGVRFYQLSPEDFERAAHDTAILEEAILRVYEVTRAMQPVEKWSPQRRSDPDDVPRTDISERQQKVLATVLEYGEVNPSTVADRLEISASTVYRDLSVLEEHDLVFADESGKRFISPLGRDLVEAIVNTRNELSLGKVSLGKALGHIAILMQVYEQVATRFNPYSATSENVASFRRLQESIFQTIQRIIVAAEPAPDAPRPLQELRGQSFEEAAGEGTEDDAELDLGIEAGPEEKAIYRLVRTVLQQAVGEGASDIHIEPQEREVIVSFRVDGVLKEVMSIPPKLQHSVAARFKLLANLNIAENKVPQDGRFSVKLNNQRIDFRIATLPTYYGEKIVLRLLNTTSVEADLDQETTERANYLDSHRE